MSSTTRFPNGVTNVGEGTIFADLKQLAAPLYHTFMEDFDYYNTTEWSESPSGGATVSAIPIDGGAISVQIPVAGGYAATQSRRTFALADLFQTQPTKKLWFESSVMAQFPTECELSVGIADSSYSYILFTKDAGSNQFGISVVPPSVIPGPAIPVPGAFLTNTGWLRLGFVFEPTGQLLLFVNGNPAGSVPIDGALFGGTRHAPYFRGGSPSSENSALCDYFFVAKER